MKNSKLKTRLAAGILAAVITASAQPAIISVAADQPGAKLNPAMWGIFFEDINFGADGGLYAEMVKNRGFEFPDPMMGWIKIINNVAHGRVSIHDENPFNAANPSWFFDNTHRYDNYNRNGPKVFFGEYAAQSDKVVSVKNRNNLESALAEAACMTGLERNGDVVRMASYAPLFANTEAWQWKPNLIWVDSLDVCLTPNYYVQKLFANNSGDVTVPLKLDAPDGTKLYVSATRDNASGEIILKIVNGDNTPADIQLNFSGLDKISPDAKITVLVGEPNDENSFSDPQKISPKETVLNVSGPSFQHEFPANSFTILRLKQTK